RTKLFVDIVDKLNVPNGALFVVATVEPNVRLASRNLPKLEVVSSSEVNTYQLLRYPNVVITKEGLEALKTRLSSNVRRGA
ncbi:MAG: 50S ribosomal protein L4, partial [Verrucomicrobia bacterium]|nr:50S ribosomal protein L4 [Verrucomicrobiota bacterium]